MTHLTPHQSRLLERLNAERKELGLPPVPEHKPPADNGNRNRRTDLQTTEKDEVTR